MSLFSRLGDLLDERTGHRKLLEHMLDEPVKGGARWAYVFGSALLGTFLVQAVTGVALMTSYAPARRPPGRASTTSSSRRPAAGWCAACTTSARRRW
ncbi:MAG TPA: hypothetical protein VLT33_30815 [Labilithrix sp.]|nr:hypothetical protein [Labilithrix sp.]